MEHCLLFSNVDGSISRTLRNFVQCLLIKLLQTVTVTRLKPEKHSLFVQKSQFHILHEIRKRNANWIGHILRRNRLLKQVIEGKIKGEMEVTRRRGRRRKKLLDDLKDGRGYFHLKEEALDRTMWKNSFGRRFGPVVRQNTESMKVSLKFFYPRTYLWYFLGLICQNLASVNIRPPL
jgi:hypothetical protein